MKAWNCCFSEAEQSAYQLAWLRTYYTMEQTVVLVIAQAVSRFRLGITGVATIAESLIQTFWGKLLKHV